MKTALIQKTTKTFNHQRNWIFIAFLSVFMMSPAYSNADYEGPILISENGVTVVYGDINSACSAAQTFSYTTKVGASVFEGTMSLGRSGSYCQRGSVFLEGTFEDISFDQREGCKGKLVLSKQGFDSPVKLTFRPYDDFNQHYLCKDIGVIFEVTVFQTEND